MEKNDVREPVPDDSALSEMPQAETGVTDQLTDLARRIVDEHESAITSARMALEHARHAGDLLNQARAIVPHGEWIEWVGNNCHRLSLRTAQRYMQLSDGWSQLIEAHREDLRELTIKEAIHLIGQPDASPATHLDKHLDASSTANAVDLDDEESVDSDAEPTESEVRDNRKRLLRVIEMIPSVDPALLEASDITHITQLVKDVARLENGFASLTTKAA